MPHFIVGAQKNIVFGPAGWLMNARALCAKELIGRAAAVTARAARLSRCCSGTLLEKRGV